LFIHINYIKLHKIKLSPFLAVAQDGHLHRVTIPEAAYVQFASLASWWWADCARNM